MYKGRMDKGLEILSKVVTWSKYSKYIPELSRRETWEEIVDRYLLMMMKKYPSLRGEIAEKGKFILEKKVLPSMRMLQFAGPAIGANEVRGFNCSYAPVDSIYAFSEAMFLLLSGVGLGYSVQWHHVDMLPSIQKPTKKKKFVITDDITGWADAVKVLIKAFLAGGALPNFDFSQIRPKGSRLITAGGKAPGPGPLKECLHQIQRILEEKEEGSRLKPIECHEIMCHIANSVLAGGIRRSACISLFSPDDEEMLTCKYGEWWIKHEEFGRSNNSVVLKRGDVSEEEFKELWKKIQYSGSGEPGVYWTNDVDLGTNPCCEISLKAFQTCNLCELNGGMIYSQQDFNEFAEIAAFFGTLQAGFTDFHYLRSVWKETCEQDALLGIGITGICGGSILELDEKEAAIKAVEVNKVVSKVIGINVAARVTCIKPAGTTSCVLGCSSGIHAWHDEYYLRTIRFEKSESIAQYLMEHHPEIVEDDVLRSHDTICVRIPIKAPQGAILRTESALDTLKRVKRYSVNWILPGHNRGDNTHNVSATISVKENEWDEVGTWMWDNQEYYNGLSILNYDGGSYIQPVFESITEQEYWTRVEHLHHLNIEEIIEEDDNVSFTALSACSGGQCSVE